MTTPFDISRAVLHLAVAYVDQEHPGDSQVSRDQVRGAIRAALADLGLPVDIPALVETFAARIVWLEDDRFATARDISPTVGETPPRVAVAALVRDRITDRPWPPMGPSLGEVRDAVAWAQNLLGIGHGPDYLDAHVMFTLLDPGSGWAIMTRARAEALDTLVTRAIADAVARDLDHDALGAIPYREMARARGSGTVRGDLEVG